MFAKTTLKAILEKPGGGYWLIDLENNKVNDLIDDYAFEEILYASLTVLTEAKTLLQKWRITMEPNLRIICLSTIKKLILSNIHAAVEIPQLTCPTEALHWIKRVINDTFDRIEKLGLKDVVALECQVIPATIAMEDRGLPFNKAKWQSSLSAIEQSMLKHKDRLLSLLNKNEGFLLFGPDPLDLNNANAVKKALEDLLGQKLLGTSQSSLKDIDHEAAKLLLLYREQARMLSAYGDNFLQRIQKGRLKGNFIPIGSASGRFACHEPNLLALPNQADFQACIEPQPPYKILSFDYNAFELRILAGLSNDARLIQIFNDKQDIHSMVAQEIFKTTVSKTQNSQLRDQAKLLNFGLIYGMSEPSLAKQLKISLNEAHNLFANYFRRFAQVGEYLRSLEKTAKHKGYAKTALGRRAKLEDSDDASGHLARVARNIPIQGTGADIIKLALCRIFNAIKQANLDAYIINLIHDEMVIECHKEDIDQLTLLVKQEMALAFNAILPNVLCEISS